MSLSFGSQSRFILLVRFDDTLNQLVADNITLVKLYLDNSRNRFQNMNGHEMRIPPCQMNDKAHRNAHNPCDPGIFPKAPMQQRKQQVQEKNASQEPFAYAGEVRADPSGRHGEIIQSQHRQQQRRRFCRRIVPGIFQKPPGEEDHPGQPEQRINCFRPFLVEGDRVLVFRHSKRQSRTRYKEE